MVKLKNPHNYVHCDFCIYFGPIFRYALFLIRDDVDYKRSEEKSKRQKTAFCVCCEGITKKKENQQLFLFEKEKFLLFRVGKKEEQWLPHRRG